MKSTDIIIIIIRYYIIIAEVQVICTGCCQRGAIVISFGLLNVGFEEEKFAKILFARKLKFCFPSCLFVLGDVKSRAELIM